MRKRQNEGPKKTNTTPDTSRVTIGRVGSSGKETDYAVRSAVLEMKPQTQTRILHSAGLLRPGSPEGLVNFNSSLMVLTVSRPTLEGITSIISA